MLICINAENGTKNVLDKVAKPEDRSNQYQF